MRILTVDLGTGRSYELVFDALSRLGVHLSRSGLTPGHCLVVSDDHVAELYLESLLLHLRDAGWRPSAINIPAGESSKSAAELERLYDFAMEARVDRTTPVIAFGGGVVGDLAGFCAATLLRGVPLVHVPTTLVAQVDSSIGGKTGINHRRGKNLIGAFYQPRLVLSDPTLLSTLPQREWEGGLAELVKHALIESPGLVAHTIRSWDGLSGRDESTLREMVPLSAGVKVSVVVQDEREAGVRAFLNLGHTLAHGVEQAAGYGRLIHGEAVAVGLRAALRISAIKNPAGDFGAGWKLVNRLPTPDISGIAFDSIADAMMSDKKKIGNRLRFVLLEEIGHPVIADDVTLDDVADTWAWLASHTD